MKSFVFVLLSILFEISAATVEVAAIQLPTTRPVTKVTYVGKRDHDDATVARRISEGTAAETADLADLAARHPYYHALHSNMAIAEITPAARKKRESRALVVHPVAQAAKKEVVSDTLAAELLSRYPLFAERLSAKESRSCPFEEGQYDGDDDDLRNRFRSARRKDRSAEGLPERRENFGCDDLFSLGSVRSLSLATRSGALDDVLGGEYSEERVPAGVSDDLDDDDDFFTNYDDAAAELSQKSHYERDPFQQSSGDLSAGAGSMPGLSFGDEYPFAGSGFRLPTRSLCVPVMYGHSA